MVILYKVKDFIYAGRSVDTNFVMQLHKKV